MLASRNDSVFLCGSVVHFVTLDDRTLLHSARSMQCLGANPMPHNMVFTLGLQRTFVGRQRAFALIKHLVIQTAFASVETMS